MSATVLARYPRSVIDAARPSSRRWRNGSMSVDSAEAASSATVVATAPPLVETKLFQPLPALGTTRYRTGMGRGTAQYHFDVGSAIHEHRRHPGGCGAARDQLAARGADAEGHS